MIPNADVTVPPSNEPQGENSADREFVETVELIVQRISDPEPAIVNAALEQLRGMLRSTTTSMTCVPKTLRLLRDYLPNFSKIFSSFPTTDAVNYSHFADILSALHMTTATTGETSDLQVLKFRLLGKGHFSSIPDWGHDYVRVLVSQLLQAFPTSSEKERLEFVSLAKSHLIPFLLGHNCEAEACDLLKEIDQLELLKQFLNKGNAGRICTYLEGCVPYEPYPENVATLRILHQLLLIAHRPCHAAIVAIRLADQHALQQSIEACESEVERLQIAHSVSLHPHLIHGLDVSHYPVPFQAALQKAGDSDRFLKCASAWSLDAERTPEDVFKSHLDQRNTAATDVPKVIVATNVVFGFLNWALCSAKAITPTWVLRGGPNNDAAVVCAVASIGASFCGSLDLGLAALDPFLNGQDVPLRAGGLLGIGLLGSGGVRSESDPILALLGDRLASSAVLERDCALLGLLVAYACTQERLVADSVLPLLVDASSPASTTIFASLCVASVFSGSCDTDFSGLILQLLMDRNEELTPSPHHPLLSLSLGLFYLCKQEAADPAVAALKCLPPAVAGACEVLVQSCAYAGTGNVLLIQKLLHRIQDVGGAQSSDGEPSNSGEEQAFAVLGIALIALGEEIGTTMAFRLFTRLMHYGDTAIRKAVPLALALLYASQPQQTLVIDALAKYSHDADKAVAINACIAFGLLGFGTNNTRISNLLRALAAFYYRDEILLAAIKISQGFLVAGHSLVTIHPLLWGKKILSTPAIVSLLSVCVLLMRSEETVLGDSGYLWYLLAVAVRPRYLVTISAETGEEISVLVRVGQPVDTVAMAGTPKTLIASQTQTTPVLLTIGDRAELATDEYLTFPGQVMEGVAIVRKNPNYIDTKSSE